jgi:hypothetical protein
MTPLPRLTIAALIGLVALCAVTFAALRTSSPYWASAMVSLTVLVLLGSVVASVWGRHRAGWSGFAIFGWGYFRLAFCSPFRDVYTFECSAHAAFTLAFAGFGGLFAARVAYRAATTSGAGPR